MGQGQSSSNASSAQPVDVKISYYELLDVERQATEEEIKKAYRRKALELHPDRNYGKEDEATRLFSEISAAYEVLSDPQERAWYDSHELAILRGADVGDEHYEGNVKVTTADDVLAMIGKFNGRVRFDDSPDGFFGYLNEAFARLAREEQIAANIENIDVDDFPIFGHEADTHEDAQIFYRGWSGFSTKKTYAWKDMYRLNEAPDRRIRKLMEKENQKSRDKAKKEFNDAVRTLIQFVRRRDPRYVPNVQSEEERQKALREASAAQAARARAVNASKAADVVPEWTKVRDPEEEESESEGEIEEEQFECVACHKTFKSEKQFEAHEKSKKHQKAVFALQKKMQRDNEDLNLDAHISTKRNEFESANDIEDEEYTFVEAEIVSDIEAIDLDDDDDDSESGSTTDRRTNSKINHKNEQESETDEGDSDYAPRSDVESRLHSKETSSRNPVENTELGSPQNLDLEDDAGESHDAAEQRPAQKKLGKAAQKRAKKAAKSTDAESEDSAFKCAVCDSPFPSKSRMFQHIKDFGHAAPVNQVGKKKGKGKK